MKGNYGRIHLFVSSTLYRLGFWGKHLHARMTGVMFENWAARESQSGDTAQAYRYRQIAKGWYWGGIYWAESVRLADRPELSRRIYGPK